MDIKHKVLGFVAAVFLTACSSSDLQTDRPYQDLGRAKHFWDFQDGYLISIEKRSKTGDNPISNFQQNICFTDKSGNSSHHNDGYQARFKLRPGNDEISDDRNDHFTDVMCNQMKIMTPTHITAHFGSIDYLHNAYSESLTGSYDYEAGFTGLDSLAADLTNRLSCSDGCGAPYSHILVMAMGWNNDQLETVYRFNQIKKHLLAAAIDSPDFKPLIIGFSWPSVWGSLQDNQVLQTLSHLGSYFNKANDADEVGYSYGNYLINHLIPTAMANAESNNNPKVVVIGHSFGARLLSRAVFARPHLRNSPGNAPALFIGLQGAFSANRFVFDEGGEGHPYSEFAEENTKVVLTTSVHDSANPAAHWITGASHVGGSKGLDIAREFEDDFELVTWPQNGQLEMDMSQAKVLMIDASEIVKDTEQPGYKYSAHNDILDAEMGELIFAVIEQGTMRD